MEPSDLLWQEQAGITNVQPNNTLPSFNQLVETLSVFAHQSHAHTQNITGATTFGKTLAHITHTPLRAVGSYSKVETIDDNILPYTHTLATPSFTHTPTHTLHPYGFGAHTVPLRKKLAYNGRSFNYVRV